MRVINGFNRPIGLLSLPSMPGNLSFVEARALDEKTGIVAS